MLWFFCDVFAREGDATGRVVTRLAGALAARAVTGYSLPVIGGAGAPPAVIGDQLLAAGEARESAAVVEGSTNNKEQITNNRAAAGVRVAAVAVKPSRAVAGVRVERVWATTFHKSRAWLLGLNALTTTAAYAWAALWRLRRGDVVVLVTSPRLLPWPVTSLARVRGARVIVLVHDVYPDVFAAVGWLSRESAVFRALNAGFVAGCRRAERVVVLGRDMEGLLQRRMAEDGGRRVEDGEQRTGDGRRATGTRTFLQEEAEGAEDGRRRTETEGGGGAREPRAVIGDQLSVIDRACEGASVAPVATNNSTAGTGTADERRTAEIPEKENDYENENECSRAGAEAAQRGQHPATNNKEPVTDNCLRPGSRTKVTVIPNWGDVDMLRVIAKEASPVTQRWDLTGKFVIGVGGTLGRTHDAGLVAALAEELRGDERVVLLVYASGVARAELEEAVRRRGLGNVRLAPPCAPAELNDWLAAADAMLIPFRAGMAGISVPSRMYNIFAAGRPLLVAGDTESEAARVTREADVGWAVAAGDVGACVAAVQAMLARPEEVVAKGRRARSLVEREYTFEKHVRAWRGVVG